MTDDEGLETQVPHSAPGAGAGNIDDQAAARAREVVEGQLRGGTLNLAELLYHVDGEDNPVVGGMTVRDALMALPGVAEARTAKILDEADLTGDETLASLSPDQRAALERHA